MFLPIPLRKNVYVIVSWILTETKTKPKPRTLGKSVSLARVVSLTKVSRVTALPSVIQRRATQLFPCGSFHGSLINQRTVSLTHSPTESRSPPYSRSLRNHYREYLRISKKKLHSTCNETAFYLYRGSSVDEYSVVIIVLEFRFPSFPTHILIIFS